MFLYIYVKWPQKLVMHYETGEENDNEWSSQWLIANPTLPAVVSTNQEGNRSRSAQ